MKWFKKTSGIIWLLVTITASIQAQDVIPLMENSWDNPDFVKRFTGSYGVRSEIEPTITAEESELFQQVALLMGENNNPGAIELIHSSISDESSAALIYTLGTLYLQGGDLDNAINSYNRAIKQFPEFMRAYKNMGLALIQQGKFPEAAKRIVMAIELGDTNGDTFGLLGYCYLNQGDYSSALDAYRLAHVLNPSNLDWMIGKAQCLMQIGEYDEAIAKFKQLIEKKPNRTVFYSSIINALLAKGDSEKVTGYIELVRRMGDADANMLSLLGDIYMNRNLSELAIKAYKEALAKKEGIAPARYLGMVGALIYRGEIDEALGILEEFESYFEGKNMPESQMLKSLNLKAEIASQLDDRTGAIAILEEVVDRDPLNGEALLLLAGYQWDGNEFELADFYYERAQSVNGSQVEAYVAQARMKVAQKDYSKAVELLESAQSIDPQSNVGRYLEAVKAALMAVN